MRFLFFLVRVFVLSIVLFFPNCPFRKAPKLKFAMALTGVIVSESSGSTDVMEGINTDSFTITLNTQPLVDTWIRVDFDSSQIKLNSSLSTPSVIAFTPYNWNQPQTVSVFALYDNVTEGNHKSVISFKNLAQSLNPTILGTVTVNITDNLGSRLTSSFQSGSVTVGATNPVSVSLSRTVDPTKAYVYCNFRMPLSNLNRATTCQLSTSGNSVLIESGVASSTTYVNWYVVEFSIGADIQRGSDAFSTTDLTKSITLSRTVDLNRTFIIAYSRTSDGNNNNDEERTTRVRLTDSNTIELSRNENGIAVNIEWQVIQLDGAKVQSGLLTIANGSNSGTATIDSVNLSSAFILHTLQPGSSIDGRETNYYINASYSSSTEVSFSRTGSTGTVDIAWFAIEMIDGTTVQSGNVIVSSTSTFGTATLSTVDTSKTMVIMSYQIAAGTGGSAADQDSGTFSATFNSSTQIQFDRFTADSNACTITWYAIQFQ